MLLESSGIGRVGTAGAAAFARNAAAAPGGVALSFERVIDRGDRCARDLAKTQL